MTRHFCDKCGDEVIGTYWVKYGLMLCRMCYRAVCDYGPQIGED